MQQNLKPVILLMMMIMMTMMVMLIDEYIDLDICKIDRYRNRWHRY